MAFIDRMGRHDIIARYPGDIMFGRAKGSRMAWKVMVQPST